MKNSTWKMNPFCVKLHPNIFLQAACKWEKWTQGFVLENILVVWWEWRCTLKFYLSEISRTNVLMITAFFKENKTRLRLFRNTEMKKKQTVSVISSETHLSWKALTWIINLPYKYRVNLKFFLRNSGEERADWEQLCKKERQWTQKNEELGSRRDVW